MNILFDMDDTLVETRKWFLGFCAMIGYPVPETDAYHLETVVPARLIDFALAEAPFMLHADPVPFIKSTIRSLEFAGHVVGFCTHRGYHPEGYARSVAQLKSIGISGDLHCIDPLEYPCKLEYLDSVYAEPYVLVDDRPPNLASTHGKVIIYSRPWNKGLIGHRINDLRDLPRVLTYVA